MKVKFKKQPVTFYKELEKYVMGVIKSGKYRGLEDYVMERDKYTKEIKVRMIKGKPVTHQELWFARYNKGIRMNVVDELESARLEVKLTKKKKDLAERERKERVMRGEKEKPLTEKEIDAILSKKVSNKIDKYMDYLNSVGELDNFFEKIRNDWLDSHEKFIEFCANLAEEGFKPSLVESIDKSKSGVVQAKIEDIIKSMEEWSRSMPGVMNITGANELFTGLSYCLSYANIDVGVDSSERYFKFSKLRDVRQSV